MLDHIVLATRNVKKKIELQAILAEVLGREIRVSSAAELELPEVRETGLTFAENALLKARSAADASGLPAIADDSGLAVDVLGGAPGIFSARWAGTHGDDVANYRLLLDQLSDIAAPHRTAAFVCAAAYVEPGGVQFVEVGRFEGSLAMAPRGSAGFGYDPIFAPAGDDRTAAELTAEEKNARSHRRLALTALAEHLRDL
ncbi:RdgB/HAM1 family non-canonical purine NTP pyrophosphatase [Brevibacterium daeguense]|uniref:dITP/XTP pyrophosphatase n=1 Tax=Brevibacterium daeguense TaxID=909936 RepID=A0ABP8EM83_9MICO|nr:RdgB/HAM1 family non-canonical purine NTP pyrophosphatase [Brevibacterium daeguense]